MSEIKVNKISPRSGTTVTLGDSGDTFTIPSGATINNQGTATNFGATGSASWTTTVKTSGFTAVAGEGYFVDTSSGAVSVNLPAGTPGAVVAFKDYLNSFDTHNLTLVQNGSDKIGGSTVNATLDVEGIAVTLVFVDSTRGWLVTDSGLESEAPTAAYISATGGSISTVCTNFKVHTFTGPGTFCISSGTGPLALAEYIVVAGGGGGGGGYGAGAGAGGFRIAAPTLAPLTYPGKPLSTTGQIMSPGPHAITVGGGGTGSTGSTGSGDQDGTKGSNSVFTASSATITAAGGGAGAMVFPACNQVGGSGGGGSVSGPGTPQPAGGSGNSPPVNPAQGTDGGTGFNGGCYGQGGGGGAITVGSNGTGPDGGPGGAGAGIPTAFGSNGVPCGSFRYYAGGGGGGRYGPAGNGGGGAPGGAGGGGRGNTNGCSGTTNSGGGGGGANKRQPCGNNGGNGGSGVVIIRYRFQA